MRIDIGKENLKKKNKIKLDIVYDLGTENISIGLYLEYRVVRM